MFNWVCPNCGKEVPPSKTACPYCPGVPEPTTVQPPPSYPGYAYPAPAYPPQAPAQGYPQQGYAPPVYAQPGYAGGYSQPGQPTQGPPPQTGAPQAPPPQAPPPQPQNLQGYPNQNHQPGYGYPPQPGWTSPAPGEAWQTPEPVQAAPPPQPPPPPEPLPPVYEAPTHNSAPAWPSHPSSHQTLHQPPPPSYQPQYSQRQHAPAWQAPPPEKTGRPAWLMGVGVTAVILAVLAGLYFVLLRQGGHANAQEKAGLENPSNPSAQKVSNPLQKYVEVVGIRIISQDKKPAARFIVVNHSTTDIRDLQASVTVWASTSRSEEDSVGAFSFKLPLLIANGSKEMTELLKTRLKAYELPDWQNATAEIQITSPQD